MWNSPTMGVRQEQRILDRTSGNMAHRKGLISAKVGIYLGAALVLALLLGGRVVALNQMTAMRANIASLQDRKDFLRTQSASLQSKWNEATSAQVVCARAHRELGLVQPDEPDLVLVKLPVQDQASGWSWSGLLADLAGGQPAQAGNLELAYHQGEMIHLDRQIKSPTEQSQDQGRLE